MNRFQWIEDVFDLPAGVFRLGPSESVNKGKTLVMYHGTTRANAESILATGFRPSADGMLGRGVYLSRDLQKASRYPIDHPESDRVVIQVQVNVGKVIVINKQGHPKQKTWHEYGYDTAWVPPDCGMVKSGLEENCVWDPKRIRILKTIKPITVQAACVGGAWGFMSAGTNRSRSQWVEDVLDLSSESVNKGRTLVIHHGTTRTSLESILATGFCQSADGMLGRGVCLSRDLQRARRHQIGHPGSDRVVTKAVVNVGKVVSITYQGHTLHGCSSKIYNL